jgi:hypothetical protein
MKLTLGWGILSSHSGLGQVLALGVPERLMPTLHRFAESHPFGSAQGRL